MVLITAEIKLNVCECVSERVCSVNQGVSCLKDANTLWILGYFWCVCVSKKTC